MRELAYQTEFEQLLGMGEPGKNLSRITIVYFTASWCGACRFLDLDTLEATSPEIQWLKCDIDANSYTPGYCNIRSIPTFLAIVDKKVAGTLQHNKTAKVVEWAQWLVEQL